MSLIHLDTVSKHYGANEVIRGVSWRIEPGHHVGLVGRNGCGKTTLFHMMTGRLLADDGQIHRQSTGRVGFLPQDPEFDGAATVLRTALKAFQHLLDLGTELSDLEARMAQGETGESLLSRYGQVRDRYEMDGGYALEARAKAILFGLGFNEQELSQQVETLSGGQKNRLMLAQLLAREPDLLLLDEPTNHLDLGAIEWLEGFLGAYGGAYIIVSHDRYFLDKTVRIVAELSDGRLETYSGGYSYYVAERARRRDRQRKAHEEQQAFVARTEDFVRRNMVGQKTKQAQSRQKVLDRLDRVEPPGAEKTVTLRFESALRGGDRAVEIEGLSAGFGETELFGGLNLVLRRGDRLGIVGPNGSGKTTLLRLLTGQLKPTTGHVRLGRNIKIGYYDQAREDLDSEATVLDEVWSITPGATMGEMRNFLGAFLFSGDDVTRTVGTLSGGERSRVALAKLMRTRLNLLILDEPTNHLDIPARSVLEDALGRFDGTLVTVSHDRYFLNRLVTRLLVLGQGRHRFVEGNYDALLRQRTADEDPTPEASQEASAKAARKEAYARARQETRELERLKRAAGQLQEKIATLEQKAETLDVELAREDLAADWERLGKINHARSEVQQEIDSCFSEWETIEEQLDRTQTHVEDTGR